MANEVSSSTASSRCITTRRSTRRFTDHDRIPESVPLWNGFSLELRRSQAPVLQSCQGCRAIAELTYTLAVRIKTNLIAGCTHNVSIYVYSCRLTG